MCRHWLSLLWRNLACLWKEYPPLHKKTPNLLAPMLLKPPWCYKGTCSLIISPIMQALKLISSHVSRVYSTLSIKKQQHFLDNVLCILEHLSIAQPSLIEACCPFKTSIRLQCPLYYQTDSGLHILLGCRHQTISDILTELHDIACDFGSDWIRLCRGMICPE